LCTGVHVLEGDEVVVLVFAVDGGLHDLDVVRASRNPEASFFYREFVPRGKLWPLGVNVDPYLRRTEGHHSWGSTST
jgi:hypothetical protein